jgi:hypothetical protein
MSWKWQQRRCCSTTMSTQFFFVLLDFEVFIQLSIVQGAIIPVENLPIFQKNTKTDVAVCSVKRLTISMMPVLQVRAPPVKCICMLAPSCKKKGVGNLHPYFITSIPVTSFQKSDGINQYGCQQRFRACWVNLTSVLSVEYLACISKLFLRCTQTSTDMFTYRCGANFVWKAPRLVARSCLNVALKLASR